MTHTLTICPHCGYDLCKEEPVTLGVATYVPRVGLYYNGKRVPIPPSSMADSLAQTLLKARGSIVSQDVLVERLGIDAIDERMALFARVWNLRTALEPFGGRHHVKAERGLGLRWAA